MRRSRRDRGVENLREVSCTLEDGRQEGDGRERECEMPSRKEGRGGKRGFRELAKCVITLKSLRKANGLAFLEVCVSGRAGGVKSACG